MSRLVASSESYYRIMYYGSRASWNLRDSHMFETLRTLLDFHGSEAKAIVCHTILTLATPPRRRCLRAASTILGIYAGKNSATAAIPSGWDPIRAPSRRLPIGTVR